MVSDVSFYLHAYFPRRVDLVIQSQSVEKLPCEN